MSDYYGNKLEDSKGNMKETWNILNEIMGGKGKETTADINLDGCNLGDSNEIVNKFANFFSNIGSKVQSSVSNKYNEMNCNIINDVRGETLNIEFQPCTSEEVRKVVQSLESNSAGVDGLPLQTVKVILRYILPCLVFIINLSLEKGSFPVQFKVAKVIPFHKGGRKSDIENWRPTSILPIFSKILEKVVHKRLYNFLHMNRLLSQTQFGFRKGHSTTHAFTAPGSKC